MTNVDCHAHLAGRFLRAPDAANFLSLSVSTLAKMRLRGDGPPYSKAGPRTVIYSIDDLVAWVPCSKAAKPSS